MRLAKAASFFDQMLCVDAFAPTTSFYGQLDLFDDSRRDGTTVVRRILSVSPSVVMPARRVLTIHEQQWLVGQNEPDSFRGSVIRQKYVVHRADGACAIRTPGQTIAGAGGTSTYGSRLWVKDFKEQEQSSRLEGFFNVYLPKSEAVAAGQIVTLASRLYWVRNFFFSAAGFLVAESDELAADALQSGTFKAQSYDPATDGTSTSASTAVTVIRLRWQDDYAYSSESSEQYVAGDIRALVRVAALAAAPKVKDILSLSDGNWRVISSKVQSDVYALHLRRAGT